MPDTAPTPSRPYGSLTPRELLTIATDHRDGLAEHLARADHRDPMFDVITGAYTGHLGVALIVAHGKLRTGADGTLTPGRPTPRPMAELALAELVGAAYSLARDLDKHLQTEAAAQERSRLISSALLDAIRGHLALAQYDADQEARA